MYQAVTRNDFIDAFSVIRPENFTTDGLDILFDYIEDVEESTGQRIELDVIALCCDYSEETAAQIAEDYGIDVSECEDEEELHDAVLAYLEDNTTVCGETGTTIVYATF